MENIELTPSTPPSSIFDSFENNNNNNNNYSTNGLVETPGTQLANSFNSIRLSSDSIQLTKKKIYLPALFRFIPSINQHHLRSRNTTNIEIWIIHCEQRIHNDGTVTHYYYGTFTGDLENPLAKKLAGFTTWGTLKFFGSCTGSNRAFLEYSEREWKSLGYSGPWVRFGGNEDEYEYVPMSLFPWIYVLWKELNLDNRTICPSTMKEEIREVLAQLVVDQSKILSLDIPFKLAQGRSSNKRAFTPDFSIISQSTQQQQQQHFSNQPQQPFQFNPPSIEQPPYSTYSTTPFATPYSTPYGVAASPSYPSNVNSLNPQSMSILPMSGLPMGTFNVNPSIYSGYATDAYMEYKFSEFLAKHGGIENPKPYQQKSKGKMAKKPPQVIDHPPSPQQQQPNNEQQADEETQCGHVLQGHPTSFGSGGFDDIGPTHYMNFQEQLEREREEKAFEQAIQNLPDTTEADVW